MLRHISTPDAPPPFSKYSQAVGVSASEHIFVSGQVGVTPDGTLLDGDTAQNEQIWRNILAILADSGLGAEHIVEVTVYLTGGATVATCREVRERMLGDARPASSMVIVAGLADPCWLVEISVVAAKP